jgi:hypothetical protein
MMLELSEDCEQFVDCERNNHLENGVVHVHDVLELRKNEAEHKAFSIFISSVVFGSAVLFLVCDHAAGLFTGTDKSFTISSAFNNDQVHDNMLTISRSLAEVYEMDIDTDPRIENFVSIFKLVFVLFLAIGVLLTIGCTRLRGNMLEKTDHMGRIDSKDKLLGMRTGSNEATRDQLCCAV